MRHDWYDPRPNCPALLMEEPFRECRNCGKTQRRSTQTWWMRIVDHRWLTLVCRCKGTKKSKEGTR